MLALLFRLRRLLSTVSELLLLMNEVGRLRVLSLSLIRRITSPISQPLWRISSAERSRRETFSMPCK